MSACEKCWRDAYMRAIISGKSQTSEYYIILEERKDNPCTEGKGPEYIGNVATNLQLKQEELCHTLNTN